MQANKVKISYKTDLIDSYKQIFDMPGFLPPSVSSLVANIYSMSDATFTLYSCQLYSTATLATHTNAELFDTNIITSILNCSSSLDVIGTHIVPKNLIYDYKSTCAVVSRIFIDTVPTQIIASPKSLAIIVDVDFSNGSSTFNMLNPSTMKIANGVNQNIFRYNISEMSYSVRPKGSTENVMLSMPITLTGATRAVFAWIFTYQTWTLMYRTNLMTTFVSKQSTGALNGTPSISSIEAIMSYMSCLTCTGVRLNSFKIYSSADSTSVTDMIPTIVDFGTQFQKSNITLPNTYWLSNINTLDNAVALVSGTPVVAPAFVLTPIPKVISTPTETLFVLMFTGFTGQINIKTPHPSFSTMTPNFDLTFFLMPSTSRLTGIARFSIRGANPSLVYNSVQLTIPRNTSVYTIMFKITTRITAQLMLSTWSVPYKFESAAAVTNREVSNVGNTSLATNVYATGRAPLFFIYQVFSK
jgi:hypothetical protein